MAGSGHDRVPREIRATKAWTLVYAASTPTTPGMWLIESADARQPGEPGERVVVVEEGPHRRAVLEDVAEKLRAKALHLRGGRHYAANYYADGWDESAEFIESLIDGVPSREGTTRRTAGRSSESVTWWPIRMTPTS